MGEYERRSLTVLLLALIFTAFLIPYDVNEVAAADTPGTTVEPVTPTGYSFAREVGGDIMEVLAGPYGRSYPLTETGCLACVDEDGKVLWRRYYHEVDYLQYHIFPNGNLVVASDKLEIIRPNGSASELFRGGYSYEGSFKAFDDRIIYWQSSGKISCIGQEGEVDWTFRVSPVTMKGIGNDSGDYDNRKYELRRDLRMDEDGGVSFVLYDDDRYGIYGAEPCLFMKLDSGGKLSSWFEFQGLPWNNFEPLYDGSIIITEEDRETEVSFAVRIDRDGNYLWRIPIDDYSQKMVMGGRDGRMIYYRLMADYDEENLIFLYDLEGNRISHKKALPRSTTDIRIIGENILITDMGNGSVGEIMCFDKDMEHVWSGSVVGGISSNIIDAGDGSFFLLGNGSILQRWSVEGELLTETRVWPVDNLYMNSHMESLMDYEIGYVYLDSKVALDEGSNIYLGLMRLYKIGSSGELQWDLTLDGAIESSPIEGVNGDVIVGGMDGHLYSFDKEGNERWCTEIGSTINSRPMLNLSRDGYIVLGSMGRMRMVRPDGTIKWSYRLNGSVYSQPLQDKFGNILAVTWKGTFFSFFPNGTVNWTLVLDRTVSSDLHFVGEHRICFFAWGDLVKIDLLNRSYEVIDYGEDQYFYSGPFPIGNGEMVGINDTVVWFDMEGNILRHCRDLEYLWWSHVEVGPDGRIFIGEGNSGDLHCLLPNGTLDWSIELGERNVRPSLFGNYTLLVACESLSKVDPYTGEVIWNFKMDFRTHIQGYTWNLPFVMSDGSILFCFDRIYRFTDTDTRGQITELEVEPYYGWRDAQWSYDVPVDGAFVKGFTLYRNDTEGRMVEYGRTNFEDTRIYDREINRSLVYEYQIEWYDHLGNSGFSRVFNTSEDYGNYIDVTPYDSRPRNLTLSFKDGKVHLDWEPPVDVDENPVYHYEIYRYENDDWVLVAEVDFDVFHYEDGNVSLYTGYYYYVASWTDHGYTPMDESVHIYTEEPLDPIWFITVIGVPFIVFIMVMIIGTILVKFRKDGPVYYDERGEPIKEEGNK
ncbi:MAG: PQQ-binding-like beta-propeller repeat protein [Thermoplasmatota archaeon]